MCTFKLIFIFLFSMKVDRRIITKGHMGGIGGKVHLSQLFLLGFALDDWRTEHRLSQYLILGERLNVNKQVWTGGWSNCYTDSISEGKRHTETKRAREEESSWYIVSIYEEERHTGDRSSPATSIAYCGRTAHCGKEGMGGPVLWDVVICLVYLMTVKVEQLLYAAFEF